MLYCKRYIGLLLRAFVPGETCDAFNGFPHLKYGVEGGAEARDSGVADASPGPEWRRCEDSFVTIHSYILRTRVKSI